MGFGARRSASTPGESRGALRLVNLNADGARGKSRQSRGSPRRRDLSARLGTHFHDFRGGEGLGSGGFYRAALVSSHTVAWRRRRVQDGWVRVGRDDGERFAVRAVESCADGRVVRARGAMEAEGRVDSAHSRVFPGKSTANGRFLGFSAAHSLFSPRSAMDYSISRAPAFLVPSHARRRRVVSRRCL